MKKDSPKDVGASVRAQLRVWSQTGLNFARQHSFEKTFARRVEHYRAVANAGVN
jgi:hypothetical protein